MKNLSKNFVMAFFGMGFVIGAIDIGWPRVILLGVGLGMMLGGIFGEIKTLKEKKSS